MRVLIAFNPISGAGRAESAARAAADFLRENGHQAAVMPTHLGASRLWLDIAAYLATLVTNHLHTGRFKRLV